MKRLICLIVSFSIFHSGLAHAGAANATPEAALQLVDEYLALVPSEAMLSQIAETEYIAQGVAVQIEGLVPEDFNVFLLHLMERYIAQPEKRAALFSLLKIVRGEVASDLEHTAKLREGPGDTVMHGAMVYGFLILMSIVVLRKPFARLTGPVTRTRLLTSLRRKTNLPDGQ